jgi:hypothetical protein
VNAYIVGNSANAFMSIDTLRLGIR